ncbi:hypothetical protein MRB53_041023 [Persea americana]|nr:hypothetical protein MRB53_041023 [Persea americana]
MPKFSQAASPTYWRVCWDARTPKQDWLLCRHPHPQLSQLFFATGGSFHSYKFLPTIGQYMANVLRGTGNGKERDVAWGWKAKGINWRGAHEATAPQKDWSEFFE